MNSILRRAGALLLVGTLTLSVTACSAQDTSEGIGGTASGMIDTFLSLFGGNSNSISVGSGSGSAPAVTDTGSAESADAGTDTAEDTAAADENLPASQQETEQYLEVAEDGEAPSYAKLYPGLYAEAQDTPTEESDTKVAYLTFDDGPSDTVTPKILDTLKEYNVKATFFLVGSYVEEYPELVQRMVDEGHTIGIHCYVHEYDTIYAGVHAYLKDFAKAYDAIYDATGYRVQIFRFPGGSNNTLLTGNKKLYNRLTSEMTRRGFEYYDWNAYDGDAEGSMPSSSKLASRAVEEIGYSSRNDAIVLMHDTFGKEHTAKALSTIIEDLQDDDIEMLPITASTRAVHFQVNDNTPSEYHETAEEASSDETDSASDDSDS